MNISLSATESKQFYEVINSEMRCVINEWDDDTCRCPGKKRMNDAKYGKSILDKWFKTQTVVNTPQGGFINLDKIVSCTLDLTPQEAKYSKALLDKAVKELNKELAKVSTPYTGIYKVFNDSATVAATIATYL